MGGLYINEISLVQLISLYQRVHVIGVYIDVVFTSIFCGKWMRIFFFFISCSLLILTIVIEETLGR